VKAQDEIVVLVSLGEVNEYFIVPSRDRQVDRPGLQAMEGNARARRTATGPQQSFPGTALRRGEAWTLSEQMEEPVDVKAASFNTSTQTDELRRIAREHCQA
jgi:hypothetical protein